jgi:sulfonate dioxygenase
MLRSSDETSEWLQTALWRSLLEDMLTNTDSDIRAYGDMAGEYHSDHSHEANPPAYTMLRMVRTPEFGGDTIFTSQTALFDKLSPTFQKLFEGLHGVHSSEV